MEIAEIIAGRMGLKQGPVERTIALLDEGATIPFISRYRKEATGGMDEVQVAQVQRLNDELNELVRRREYITEAIAAQGKLTDDLAGRLAACWDPAVLEDLYLPYKTKRKTRAEVARKRGLAPLAALMMDNPYADPMRAAAKYIGDEVPDAEAALQGARDIIAETVNEDERTRQTLRTTFARTARITSKVVKSRADEARKYSDYFDATEPLNRCSSHRLLAMRRGEAEGYLRVGIAPADEEESLRRLERPFVKWGTPAAPQVQMAVEDAYKRLLKPSIENEFAAAAKARADEEAIAVFAANVRQLLLSPPLGAKRIMGIDPGFRTGCKVVCIDAQGNLLHNETIYPHEPKREWGRSVCRIAALADTYGIEAIAVGNGTAGRETEDLVREAHLDGVEVFVVSEDGASVYSASDIAREEFPDKDVTVRGAVSIARRLADPLAELVKIDPKAIGVGQYQHDVDQGALHKALDLAVTLCVNTVGVNLNTASRHLLTYVSGLGPALAARIIDYRTEHGPFRSRRQLLDVPRLGAKAYEQCAGFLRIPDADNPLDNTAVHPERYALVEQMARDAGCDVRTLIADEALRQRIDLDRYCSDTVGRPTLQDIMSELDRPGRDPRGVAHVFAFDPNIRTIDDLSEGMVLPGVVTNITQFGCFVDLGIKVKGLIHISQMAQRRVKDPAEVVHLRQQLRVRVLSIDVERGRIGLSLRGVE